MKKSNNNLEGILDFDSLCAVVEVLKKDNYFKALSYFLRIESQGLAHFLSSHPSFEKSLVIAKQFLVKNLKNFGEGTTESWLFNHQIRVLQFLEKNLETLNSIKKISIKSLDSLVSKVISDSLRIPAKELNEEKLLESILVCLLYPLRQTIGACFATSLVIVLQNEEKKLFLEELIACIIHRGIKRIIDGKEHNYPMNVFLENRELNLENPLNLNFRFFNPPPLLKCFEYTIASMTEYGLNTQQFSLTACLGLDPSIVDGLGSELVGLIREELIKVEQEVHQAQIEAQKSLDHVNMIHSQFYQASSYEKAQSLKAQEVTYSSHMRACVERRDQLVQEADVIAELFKKWTQVAQKVFKSYFQDIFDPNIRSSIKDYHDSPAGFRLICNHGRQNVLAWTQIDDENQFISCLKEFFLYLENTLISEFKSQKIKNIITAMTSKSVEFIFRKEFIELALKNLKRFNLSYEYTTPWSYLSGGNLKSLLSCFLSKEKLSNEIILQVQEPLDLLIKLVDLLKDFPLKFQDRFVQDVDRGILAQNEFHAFVIKPGYLNFTRFWADKDFSYTTIRDLFILPMIRYYDEKILNHQEIYQLNELFKSKEVIWDYGSRVKLLDILDFIQGSHDDIACIIHTFLKKSDPHFPKINSIKFADTNWPFYFFSFVVNPINLKVEIWRENFDGNEFYPMKKWSNSDEEPKSYSLYLDTLDKINFSSYERLKFQYKV